MFKIISTKKQVTTNPAVIISVEDDEFKILERTDNCQTVTFLNFRYFISPLLKYPSEFENFFLRKAFINKDVHVLYITDKAMKRIQALIEFNRLDSWLIWGLSSKTEAYQ